MKNYMEVIENVAKLMEKYDLNSVSYNENASSVHLAKNGSYPMYAPMPNVGANFTAETKAAAAVTEEAPAKAEAAHAPVVSPAQDDAKEVKSPMVGVFFTAPSPTADPFVRIGDTVKKGDVLCILEAMKLMNEIQAEQDGIIADICAQNGDVVEFGQVLFKIA